jgi:hypothetical protein
MLKLPAQILILNDEKHNTMHRYVNTLINQTYLVLCKAKFIINLCHQLSLNIDVEFKV